MNTSLRSLLLALVLLGGRDLAAQSRWLPLGNQGGTVIDLDTSSILWQPAGYAVATVRIQNYAGPGADRLETHQTHCATVRSRVLRAAEAPTSSVRDIGGVPELIRADTAWPAFDPGSLGGEIIRAICAQLGRIRPA